MSVPKLIGSYLDTVKVEVGDKTHVRLPAPLDRLDGPQLAVHRCLLSHWNDETGQCNPSHDTVSAETRFSIPTVKRALAGLREVGIWEWSVKANGVGRGRTSNSYRLHDQALNPSFWSQDQGITENFRSDQEISHRDQGLIDGRPTAQKEGDQEIALSYEQQRETENDLKQREHLSSKFQKQQQQQKAQEAELEHLRCQQPRSDRLRSQRDRAITALEAELADSHATEIEIDRWATRLAVAA